MTSKTQGGGNKLPVATKHELCWLLQRVKQKEARRHLIDLKSGNPWNSQQIITGKHRRASGRPAADRGVLWPPLMVGEGKGPILTQGPEGVWALINSLNQPTRGPFLFEFWLPEESAESGIKMKVKEEGPDKSWIGEQNQYLRRQTSTSFNVDWKWQKRELCGVWRAAWTSKSSFLLKILENKIGKLNSHKNQ